MTHVLSISTTEKKIQPSLCQHAITAIGLIGSITLVIIGQQRILLPAKAFIGTGIAGLGISTLKLLLNVRKRPLHTFHRKATIQELQCNKEIRSQVRKNILEEEKIRILKESRALTPEIKRRAQRIAEQTLYLRCNEVCSYIDDGEEETLSEFEENLFEISRIRARKADRIYLEMEDFSEPGWERAIEIERMFQTVIKEADEPWIPSDLLLYAKIRVCLEEEVIEESLKKKEKFPTTEAIHKEVKRRAQDLFMSQ